ncbi:MAG: YraN family protein [Treponema sp.]|nr:YraN family protein [Treponema sp.]
MKDTRKTIGTNGENRAAEYLKAHGFSILSRNWRTKTGEIDIIALSGDVLVFVEVKTLPNGIPETLAHVLNYRKQKRIIETSKRFLLFNRQYSKSYIRYDVIVIDMPGMPAIYHIENAFSEFL